MNCCARCFGDRGLRKEINEYRSKAVGDCSYCGATGVAVVEPTQLAEFFDLVTGAYRLDEGGRLLVEWFREDWGLFTHPRMDDSKAKDLLAEILNDGEIVRAKFSPVSAVEGDRLDEWQKLRDELMYTNRFFPEVSIDFTRFEALLFSLIADKEDVPTTWYRARIQVSDQPFAMADMGAPPKRVASHGRANPAGIPYLYLASTERTAVSEIRPHTGEMASVCEFTTPDGLKIIDLRDPRKMVSPFVLEDVTDVIRMRGDLPFLERLGEELTRPVLPHAAAIEYTPSQYLCEFIKKCSYQGVLYRSSVSEGINLALFNPSLAVGRTVSQYHVSKVSVEVKRQQ